MRAVILKLLLVSSLVGLTSQPSPDNFFDRGRPVLCETNTADYLTKHFPNQPELKNCYLCYCPNNDNIVRCEAKQNKECLNDQMTSKGYSPPDKDRKVNESIPTRYQQGEHTFIKVGDIGLLQSFTMDLLEVTTIKSEPINIADRVATGVNTTTYVFKSGRGKKVKKPGQYQTGPVKNSPPKQIVNVETRSIDTG